VSGVYPDKVSDRVGKPSCKGEIADANAVGTAAALQCGTYIRFELLIDKVKLIERVAFRSNGCGFMIAAADVLSVMLEGRRLTDLHSLDNTEIIDEINARLDRFPADRDHCLTSVIDAVKLALADFRRRSIEEFAGEKALICTCFGVSEETIELAVTTKNARSVEAVGKLCNAGTGCGSCQLLIEEIIDSVPDGG